MFTVVLGLNRMLKEFVLPSPQAAHDPKFRVAEVDKLCAEYHQQEYHVILANSFGLHIVRDIVAILRSIHLMPCALIRLIHPVHLHPLLLALALAPQVHRAG